MTRFTISGGIDIDPGQTVRLLATLPDTGFIDVTREPDLTPTQVIAGGPIGDAYTIQVHPTFLKNRVWRHTDAYMDRLLGLGIRSIRGMFAPGNAGSQRVLERCIESGTSWIATIIPEDGYDWTKTQVQNRAKAIRQAIADGARIDVELMNEPDTRRSQNDPPVPDNWPDIMVRHAQWVREILPDVWLVSCSLHAGADSFERDWARLANAGLGAPGLIDSVGIHDYDNGYEPCQLTDWRIATVRDKVGNLPIDVTEYGHTTSINNPKADRNPTSLEAARLYAWRGHLDRVVTRGVRKASRFEFLDDPDPDRKITEAGFGIVDCPSLDPATWWLKQEASVIGSGLAQCVEPDPTFVPDPVRLRLDYNVTPMSTLVTQTSGNLPVLWLWRPDTRVWDPEARQPIDVTPVDVTVTTEHAIHQVTVVGGMTAVELTEIGPF